MINRHDRQIILILALSYV